LVHKSGGEATIVVSLDESKKHPFKKANGGCWWGIKTVQKAGVKETPPKTKGASKTVQVTGDMCIRGWERGGGKKKKNPILKNGRLLKAAKLGGQIH